MNMKNVVVLVLAIAALASMAEGAGYTVGDDMGWMVPPTPDYYAKWVSKYHFVQNDTLLFNFEQGVHDITVLSKEDWDSCNMANPLFQSSKPGQVRVLSSGTFYFTCSFGQHCAKGQKFAINFADAPLPPSPSPSPSPSAFSTASLHPSPSPSPSPTASAYQAKQSRKFKFVSMGN